jgi:hypothetical protein
MRIVTHQKLVRRNRRIAQYLFFFSFGALVAAFIVANQQAFSANPSDPQSLEGTLLLILPTLVLPIGVITSMFSVRMTNLWIREPRPERVLQEGLKGLSNKSVLYNYYHFPARHVLICPQGVFAITTRFQDGRYSVSGNDWKTYGGFLNGVWRFFRRDAIGNPNEDAQNAARTVKKMLEPIAPDVEVRPLVVFIDPRVTLSIDNPDVPVLFADSKLEPNLKEYMRTIPKEARDTLTPEQIEAFEEATIPG